MLRLRSACLRHLSRESFDSSHGLPFGSCNRPAFSFTSRSSSHSQLRFLCSSSSDYKQSYDIRKDPPKYPSYKTRREEILEVAKKVHPNATIRTSDEAKNLSFRVQIKEDLPSSSTDLSSDDIISSDTVSGLLKPPAIMRGSDPFFKTQHLNRKVEREAILKQLRESDASLLSSSQVNQIYEKLRELDIMDVENGFFPTHFTIEDLKQEKPSLSVPSSLSNFYPIPSSPNLLSPINSPSNTITESIDTDSKAISTPQTTNTNLQSESTNLDLHPSHSTSKSILEGKLAISNEAYDAFTLSSTPLRRKFIANLLLNERDHLTAGEHGLLESSVSLPPVTKQSFYQYLNTLTVNRLFGLAMQVALVGPWAVIRHLNWLASKKNPRVREQLKIQKLSVQIHETKAKLVLSEMGRLGGEGQETFDASGKAFWDTRKLPFKAFWFLLKVITFYPFLAVYKVVKIFAELGYFSIAGSLDVARKIVAPIAPVFFRSTLNKALKTLWNGFAPHTWKRYALGDPFGTLWDRGVGHSEEVLKQSRQAFESTSYVVESLLLGFFHSHRIVGLILLVSLTVGAITTASDTGNEDRNPRGVALD